MTDASLAVELWARIALLKPSKAGYYRVKDTKGRPGIAFMYRNHEWAMISGEAQKPLDLWAEMI